MSEMVERGAQAIAAYLHGSADTLAFQGGEPPKEAWKFYIPAARAAIEAMREPTQAMLDDAQEALGYEVEFVGGGGNFKFCTNDLRAIQSALIDAALSEPKTE